VQFRAAAPHRCGRAETASRVSILLAV
jgi:hypothetical protein